MSQQDLHHKEKQGEICEEEVSACNCGYAFNIDNDFKHIAQPSIPLCSSRRLSEDLFSFANRNKTW